MRLNRRLRISGPIGEGAILSCASTWGAWRGIGRSCPRSRGDSGGSVLGLARLQRLPMRKLCALRFAWSATTACRSLRNQHCRSRSAALCLPARRYLLCRACTDRSSHAGRTWKDGGCSLSHRFGCSSQSLLLFPVRSTAHGERRSPSARPRITF